MPDYPTLNKTQLANLIEKLSKQYGHNYGGGAINFSGSWDDPAYYLEREKAGWIPCIASSLNINDGSVGKVGHVGQDSIDLMLVFPKELTEDRNLGAAKIYQIFPAQDTYFFGEKSGTTIPVMVKARIYYKDIKGVGTVNGQYFEYEGYVPPTRPKHPI